MHEVCGVAYVVWSVFMFIGRAVAIYHLPAARHFVTSTRELCAVFMRLCAYAWNCFLADSCRHQYTHIFCSNTCMISSLQLLPAARAMATTGGDSPSSTGSDPTEASALQLQQQLLAEALAASTSTEYTVSSQTSSSASSSITASLGSTRIGSTKHFVPVTPPTKTLQKRNNSGPAAATVQPAAGTPKTNNHNKVTYKPRVCFAREHAF